MKYPHTPYFEFSPSVDAKDTRRDGYFNVANFLNVSIIITEKMDGSNCSLTNKKVAARNGFDAPHISFDYIKSMHSQVSEKIPEDIVVFGEWLYAKHSIHYKELSGYFQVFAVYQNGHWLSWDDVEKVSGEIGFPVVSHSSPVTFHDTKELIGYITRYSENVITHGGEGTVTRIAGSFSEFKNSVAKYVRKNHVQTSSHWSKQKLIKNLLCSTETVK